METKFGNASIYNGYYVITTCKEGNNAKYLHKLVWEDFYNKPVPEGYVIHHINGDKTDNRVQNLQCCKKSEHIRFHKTGVDHSGKKNPNYGKRGELSPNWKNIPTIVKSCVRDGKQQYKLCHHTKKLKLSYYIPKLLDYAKELGFEKVEVLGLETNIK